jgi:hypothetical protein
MTSPLGLGCSQAVFRPGCRLALWIRHWHRPCDPSDWIAQPSDWIAQPSLTQPSDWIAQPGDWVAESPLLESGDWIAQPSDWIAQPGDWIAEGDPVRRGWGRPPRGGWHCRLFGHFYHLLSS